MNKYSDYQVVGEPEREEKIKNWRIAIGLQQVDGLTPSSYLLEVAKDNIDGLITIQEVRRRLDIYYEQDSIKNANTRIEEADKVSARITGVLNSPSFHLSPITLLGYHQLIFSDILIERTTHAKAGLIRDYNISKKEWVLGGRTVEYIEQEYIMKELNNEFLREKEYKLLGESKEKLIEHIARFISNIWQIHPFGEGNTRTVAAFTIQYLKTFGLEVNPALFANNSWYFRNSLVRSNYRDLKHKISYNYEFLNKFFSNLILNTNYELNNKDLLINFDDDTVNNQNGTINSKYGIVNNQDDTVNSKYGIVNSKYDTVNNQNVTVNCKNDTVKHPNDTVKQDVFSLITKNNRITAAVLAEKLGKSLITIKRELKRLKDNYIIERVGSDKTGYWNII